MASAVPEGDSVWYCFRQQRRGWVGSNGSHCIVVRPYVILIVIASCCLAVHDRRGRIRRCRFIPIQQQLELARSQASRTRRRAGARRLAAGHAPRAETEGSCLRDDATIAAVNSIARRLSNLLSSLTSVDPLYFVPLIFDFVVDCVLSTFVFLLFLVSYSPHLFININMSTPCQSILTIRIIRILSSIFFIKSLRTHVLLKQKRTCISESVTCCL
jgi:hypothetical protein